MKHIFNRDDFNILKNRTLNEKIALSQTKILEFYQHFNGNVYISYSGGKDSTVLFDLTRRMFPEVPAVYINTGLEYPEVQQFVKTKDNVTILRPKNSFPIVLKKYGFPVVSKEISNVIERARKGKTVPLAKLNGNYCRKDGKLSSFNCTKYKYLYESDFPISDKCCYHLKKSPLLIYSRKEKRFPMTGMLAEESRLRLNVWYKNGCNAFSSKYPKSHPLSFWTEQDILAYLKNFDVPYSSIYGDIVEEIDKKGEVKLKTTGADRTGCMFCMFGLHLDPEPNRLQRMAITHPKQHKYCVEKLECGKILDFMGIPYI